MKLLLIVASLLLLALIASAHQSAQTADIVFKNGNVYTANDKAPRAEAIAVKADRIVFVGSNADAQKYVGQGTRVVDLKGNTVLPGFTDSHQHLSGVGLREMTLNLEGTTSLARLSREGEGTRRSGKARRMGDWTRMDRNPLETARVSDALGSRQSRTQQSCDSRTR